MNDTGVRIVSSFENAVRPRYPDDDTGNQKKGLGV